MGTVQNVIIYAAAAAFLLVFWNGNQSTTNAFDEVIDGLTFRVNPSEWRLDTNSILTGAAVVVSVIFPNPYTIFAAAFLTINSLLTGVLDVLVNSEIIGQGISSIPNYEAIITLIRFVITVVFSLALVSWFKGSGEA